VTFSAEMGHIEPIPPQRLNTPRMGMGDLGIELTHILAAVLTPILCDGAEPFAEQGIELPYLSFGHGMRFFRPMNLHRLRAL